MGETLQREFSLDEVDTGKVGPAIPPAFDISNPLGGFPGQPGAPIMRPSFLSAFLENLGPALAGGMALNIQGNQGFGTGLAGGTQGILAHQQQQFERDIQRQQQRRLERQAELQERSIMLPNGTVVPLALARSIFPSLIGAQSREKIAAEQIESREELAGLGRQSAEKLAQLRIDMSAGRVRDGDIVNDDTSDTGFSRQLVNSVTGKVMGLRRGVLPPSSMQERETISERAIFDDQGALHIVPVRSVTKPQQAPSGAGAPAPRESTIVPGIRKEPQQAKDFRMNVAAMEDLLKNVEDAVHAIEKGDNIIQNTVKLRRQQARLPSLARFFGERGTLNEGDIKRAQNSLPGLLISLAGGVSKEFREANKQSLSDLKATVDKVRKAREGAPAKAKTNERPVIKLVP